MFMAIAESNLPHEMHAQLTGQDAVNDTTAFNVHGTYHCCLALIALSLKKRRERSFNYLEDSAASLATSNGGLTSSGMGDV